MPTQDRETRNHVFDALRAVSALGVAATHLRNGLFVGFSANHGPDLLARAFYFCTSLGHEFVVMFFLLSGYFVGGSVLSRGRGFSVGEYAVARLSRLWAVLVPSLVLTAILDHLSLALYPAVFDSAVHRGIVSIIPAAAQGGGLWVFLGNVAFLQTWIVPVFGSNGPLWSLFNEAWYYVLFPLVCCGFGWSFEGSKLKRAGFLLVAAILALVLPATIWSGFLVWVLGVLVGQFRVRMSLDLRRWWLGIVSLLALLFLASCKAGVLGAQGDLRDIILGVLGCAFLCLARDVEWKRGWLTGLARRLADCSYSLYLVHFPLVVLLVAAGRAERMPFGARAVAIFTGLLVLLQAAGFAVAQLTERQTHFLRTLMGKSLGIKAAPDSKLA